VARLLFTTVDGWHFWNHQMPLAEAALDAGHEVVVAAGADEHLPRIAAAGVEVRPLDLRRTRRPLDARRALRELESLLRAERPDLAQFSSVRAATLGGLAARRAGVRRVVRVVTGRGYVFQGAPAPLRWAVEALWRRGRSSGERCVFHNAADRELFVRRGLADPARSLVVPGSGVRIDATPPPPEPEGVPVVLYLGRMLAPKGLPELVRASLALRADGVEHRLVLAGRPDPGSPQSLDAATLERWQREGAAEWLGHRADVAPLLASCALLALPTRYGEGLPRVLLEAAAAGRPVVASDAPGCRDAVLPGETGLLHPPGDEATLAAALRELLLDREARVRMGAAARGRAEREFDAARVAARFAALYEELLAEARPAADEE
jgi:glycosyltransferase involved in cell wall biosynthesis